MNSAARLAGNVLAACLMTTAGAVAADYPREVQVLLDRARDECILQGGSKVEFAAEPVRKLDLTGGGNDYIIDLHDAECAEVASLYCGTGGCDFAIIVGRQNGAFVTVFDDRVRAYEILPGKPPRTLRFLLHGNYCGGHGNPSCPKTHRITDKPFVFKPPE